jgi:transglutaminase-like putative cysteine protease
VVEFVTVQGSHSELVVTSTSQVEVIAASAVMLEMSPPWEDVVAQLGTHLQGEWLGANGFRFESPFIRFDPTIQAFAREIFTPGRPVLDGARALTAHIHRNFSYQGGVTDIYTPASEVLRDRRGVCQDFAHLAIAALRSLGLPARYVSGYLVTHPPPGKPKLQGADESHAWFSVWCPELGWVDFDPTNNLMPSLEHITVGWGRDYGDVSPVNGFIFGGGHHQVAVAVDVHPLPERMGP